MRTRPGSIAPLDASATPLLKAQKVGEAVIGGPDPQPGSGLWWGRQRRLKMGS
ncbi:MAG: hypothetical protein NTZ74_09345 [Chloroflexi bacterium]|nr:hypothetical protein [Chloroflexota bacterium]